MKTRINEVYNEGNKPEYLSIVSSKTVAKIRIDDIEVIEQETRKLHIITADEDYQVFTSIDAVVPYLEGRAFYRAMKTLVINLKQVRNISGFYVTFQSGQSVTMGRNNIVKARDAFRLYLLSYPPYMSWEPQSRVAERINEDGNVPDEVRKMLEENASGYGENMNSDSSKKKITKNQK